MFLDLSRRLLKIARSKREARLRRRARLLSEIDWLAADLKRMLEETGKNQPKIKKLQIENRRALSELEKQISAQINCRS